MSKITISALMLACLVMNLHAAKAQGTGEGISINNLKTAVTSEMLDISFIVEASGLDLNGNGQLKLEFAVENDDRRLILPSVVYAGKLRYRYERRREELSGAYHVEPYKVYRGVKENETCR